MQRIDSLEKTLMLGMVEGRRRRRWQRMRWMVGWHHWLNGHEFEQSPGVGDGQGSLAYCRLWSHKELDTTEWLNWTELSYHIFPCVCVCVCVCVCMCAQSCPTLFYPMDYSPPGSSVHGLSRQEYWIRGPFPASGVSLTQGWNPGLLHCQLILYHHSTPEELIFFPTYILSFVWSSSASLGTNQPS